MRSRQIIITLLLILLCRFAVAEWGNSLYLITSTSYTDADTVVHIINNSSQEATIKGSLIDADGNTLGSAYTLLSATPLAPNARLTLTESDLETIFAVEPWSVVAELEVASTVPVTLFSKTTSPSGFATNSSCTAHDNVHNLESPDSGLFSLLRVINTSDTALGPITATMYNQSGAVIGAADFTLLASIPARGGRLIDTSTLQTLAGDWSGEASLYITSDASHIRLINVNLVANTFFNYSCLDTTDNQVNLPNTEPDLAAGAQIYTDSCAFCHCSDGVGACFNNAPSMMDLLDHHSEDHIIEDITNTMPPANPASCTGQCAIDVTAFMTATFNSPNAVTGQQIYADNCAFCHCADGSGGCFNNAPSMMDLLDHHSFDEIVATTETTMPPANPGNCTGECAADVTAYMTETFKSPVVSAGQVAYEQSCDNCHCADASGGCVANSPPLIGYTSQSSLTAIISSTMPPNNPASCSGQCASDIAEYLIANF